VTANQRELLKIETARSEKELKNQTLKTQLELEQLKKTLDTMKRRVEVGTANPSEIEQLVLQIRQAETQLQDLRESHDLETAKHDLRQRELEQNDVYERRRAEADQLRRKIEGLERERTDRDVERERQLERLRQAQELDARARVTYERANAEFADRLTENLPVRPDGERVRIGDVMSVEISGEPDLPRMYTVQSSGTIRLPLIGAIRAEGSTAEQVAKDLRSLLASRQLGDREVVVHTHRRE
jgi:hypothetical protein